MALKECPWKCPVHDKKVGKYSFNRDQGYIDRWKIYSPFKTKFTIGFECGCMIEEENLIGESIK